MKIPFQYYSSYTIFNDNYKKDLLRYLNFSRRNREIEYLLFLEGRYKEKIHWHHQIESYSFDYSEFISDMPSDEHKEYILNYHQLNGFCSNEAVLNILSAWGETNSNLAKIKVLLDDYYIQINGKIQFDELGYHKQKVGLMEILEGITSRIEEIRTSNGVLTQSGPSEFVEFNIRSSEVVYLLDLLVKADIIVHPKRHPGGLWNKIEKSFVAGGNPIRNARQLREKYQNSKTGKPKNANTLINRIVGAHESI